MSTGIIKLKELLSDVDGIGTITMRYEDGGKTEVYRLGDREVSLPAGLQNPEVAIRKALESK